MTHVHGQHHLDLKQNDIGLIIPENLLIHQWPSETLDAYFRRRAQDDDQYKQVLGSSQSFIDNKSVTNMLVVGGNSVTAETLTKAFAGQTAAPVTFRPAKYEDFTPQIYAATQPVGRHKLKVFVAEPAVTQG